jgi:hypothetical protein
MAEDAQHSSHARHQLASMQQHVGQVMLFSIA